MIVISKEHEADFGHRVWSQELDGEYSGSIDCKCKHLHGHRLKIVPELYSTKGLEKGMVTDFSHLKKFFNWIDQVLDHKFLLDINDPAIGPHFMPELIYFKPDILYELETNSCCEANYIVDKVPKEAQDLYDGLTIVDWVPTAENIAIWLGKEIKQYLPEYIYCKSITFYETPKSKAQWIE